MMAQDKLTDEAILQFFNARPGARGILGQLIGLGEGEGDDEAAEDRVFLALMLAGALAGDDAISRAVGEYGDTRPEKVQRLRRILELAGHFFAPPDMALIQEAEAEIEALIAGDGPALFGKIVEGRKGASHNRYKLAKLQVRALMWDAFLKCSTDLRAHEVHAMVYQAFGAPSDTYRFWKGPITQELGADYLARMLRRATGPRRGYYMANSPEAAEGKMASDGAAFKAEQRRCPDLIK